MSQVFSGMVLLPGETGDGLSASFEKDDAFVRLIAGEDELGSWDWDTCDIAPSGKGTFEMVLSGENLTFSPSSPSAFAQAMSVPLAPSHPEEESERPKFDYDAAIDEVIANIKPLRDPNDDDEILSKPVLVGIVGVSTALMAGLVTISMAL